MLKSFWLLVTSLFALHVQALELTVELRTLDDKVMPNAVVYLTAMQTQQQTQPSDIAIMDQIDRQFSPHILVVQKDTQIRFPNSDSIKHHVYSFSAAKTFELQLYRGLEADPLMFSQTGVVELGCNIHDWMLGYILVVDTPYFKKTGAAGKASFELAKGEYQLNIWHPRIAQSQDSLQQSIRLDQDMLHKVQLIKALRVDLQQYEAVPSDVSDYE